MAEQTCQPIHRRPMAGRQRRVAISIAGIAGMFAADSLGDAVARLMSPALLIMIVLTRQ